MSTDPDALQCLQGRCEYRRCACAYAGFYALFLNKIFQLSFFVFILSLFTVVSIRGGTEGQIPKIWSEDT